MRGTTPPAEWKVLPLATPATPVFVSPEPDALHASSPTLCALPSGRLVAAFDLCGPGLKRTPGPKGRLEHFQRLLQGRLYVSNDRGATWTHRWDFPFCNPLLFRDGHVLYLVGHADTMQIARSADGGETWSKPVEIAPGLPVGDAGTQSPAGALPANGAIYLPVMRVARFDYRGDPASLLAPVVLRAPQGANLTAAKSWTVSPPGPTFAELGVGAAAGDVGVPFFETPDPLRGRNVGGGRWAHRPGWSAAHLVRLADAGHYWHDPAGRTLHLIARAATHRSNLAALARVEESPQGELRIGLQTTPAGARQLLLPLPGGHLKFDLLYDEPSGLFWLLSNQARDSMTRAERLPAERYHLPADELHRLQLHFSRNLVDWCFAGFVAGADQPKLSLHSPAMAVCGADLRFVCCAGDAAARNAHDTASIVCRCIPNFRELVY